MTDAARSATAGCLTARSRPSSSWGTARVRSRASSNGHPHPARVSVIAHARSRSRSICHPEGSEPASALKDLPGLTVSVGDPSQAQDDRWRLWAFGIARRAQPHARSCIPATRSNRGGPLLIIVGGPQGAWIPLDDKGNLTVFSGGQSQARSLQCAQGNCRLRARVSLAAAPRAGVCNVMVATAGGAVRP